MERPEDLRKSDPSQTSKTFFELIRKTPFVDFEHIFECWGIFRSDNLEES